MALYFNFRIQMPLCLFRGPQSPKRASFTPLRSACMKSSAPPSQACEPTISRRSANYHPNIWDFNFVQSLRNEYTGDVHVKLAKELKEKVRNLFNAERSGSLALLELIDASQKLGIAYLFEKEIKASMTRIASQVNKHGTDDRGLHATSLCFRFLRQHGYQASEDVFISYMDGSGKFRDSLAEDVRGLLSLHEASHLAVEGECILDEAKFFTKGHLANPRQPLPPQLAKHVSHSLELPLDRRMLRLNARWYLESGLDLECNSIISDLLQLAKFDFNMVQAAHQNDLKEMSRWWVDIGLGSHPQLSFARDRLTENLLATIGQNFDPRFSYWRKEQTKLNCIITTIDDCYDIYGSSEEIESFTDAVHRWDIDAMQRLPYYMKMCFLALFNTVNGIAYVTLKEQGFDIIYFLKKSWADLCKAYLVEAKWYHGKYTPTLEEYLNNAWISIGGPVLLVHSYFLLIPKIPQVALEQLLEYPDIIRWSSMILRLCNDLGTSSAEKERGDVPKSIQCYMHETGCSEESAREHIRGLVHETWKKLNKARTDDSVFSRPFLETAVNLARMAECVYQYGDGHGIQHHETKDRVISLLIEPIALDKSTVIQHKV